MTHSATLAPSVILQEIDEATTISRLEELEQLILSVCDDITFGSSIKLTSALDDRWSELT